MRIALIVLMLSLFPAVTYSQLIDNQTSQEKALTDKEIRAILIRRSISSYSGSCACPYNTASNGSRCGGRSAYRRPGGASPLCYDRDITTAMIAMYRTQNN